MPLNASLASRRRASRSETCRGRYTSPSSLTNRRRARRRCKSPYRRSPSFQGARSLVQLLSAVNREMPLHPAARGIGRRLSGLEPRPPLLDSRRFERLTGGTVTDSSRDRTARPLMRVDRRRFMAAIAGGLVAAPLAAGAQPKSKQPTIGLIFSNTPLADVLGPQPKLRDTRAFLDGMRSLGWVDGQNITIERRSVEGQPDRFPALVQEMLALHVELVVTSWGNAPKIVTAASASLPLVMVGGTADFLIREGYVTSLARPGRTVTGLASSTGAENADKNAC